MKREYFDVHWNKWKDSLLVKWIKSNGVSIAPHSSLLEYNSFYSVVYIEINGQFLRIVDRDWFTRYVAFERGKENEKSYFENIENEFFEKYRGKSIRILDIINNEERILIVPDEIELEILRLS